MTDSVFADDAFENQGYISPAYSDLEQELAELRGAMTADDHALLSDLGVPEQMYSHGLASVGRVAFAGTRWRPDANGVTAIIIAVRVPDRPGLEALHPGSAVRFGQLRDLAAFRPDQPHAFARRFGIAPVLGVVGPQLLDPPPVLMWETPLRWLQASGDGLVILEWRAEIIAEVATQIDRPTTETAALRDKLLAIYERDRWKPKFYLPRPGALLTNECVDA